MADARARGARGASPSPRPFVVHRPAPRACGSSASDDGVLPGDRPRRRAGRRALRPHEPRGAGVRRPPAEATRRRQGAGPRRAHATGDIVVDRRASASSTEPTTDEHASSCQDRHVVAHRRPSGVIDDAAIDEALRRGGRSCAVDGHEVVVVSSGAIAAGVARARAWRRTAHRHADAAGARRRSARAALMRVYDDIARHATASSPAQVLLAPHDFVDRRQYLHARQTLRAAARARRACPIVNENDAIADDEIRFGDNDRLAALVAHLVDADLLVLLTDTPGLLTADPRLDADASLIEEVVEVDRALEEPCRRRGLGAGERRHGVEAGRGQASPSWSGVRAVIAAADRPNVLADAVAGVGRRRARSCMPHERRLPARKLWIAFARRRGRARSSSTTGARRALVEREPSLLPGRRHRREGRLRRRRRGRGRGSRRRRVRQGPRAHRRASAALRWPAGAPSELPEGMAPRGRPPRRPRRAPLTAACQLARGGRPALAGGSSGAACSGASTACERSAQRSRPSPSCARISARRVWASTFAAACSTSSMRLSTDVSVSSACPWPWRSGPRSCRAPRRTSARPRRRSRRARPSPCSSAPASWPGRAATGASDARPASAAARSRSAATAALAWSAACADCRTSALRSSTSRSSAMSRLANASAAALYSAGLGRVALLRRRRRP